jgi:hypothetical protein
MTARGSVVTTSWGETGLLYVGVDEHGVEFEVITVQRGRDELVVHAMATAERHRRDEKVK